MKMLNNIMQLEQHKRNCHFS